jgi:hypothetical protein
MEALFDRVQDRTRSRLDIPAIRTIFGLENRPHCNRKDGPPAQEIVIEKATVRAELTGSGTVSGGCS